VTEEGAVIVAGGSPADPAESDGVLALASGAGATLDMRPFNYLTVIAESGATVTVSRVDTVDASSHTTGDRNAYTVAAESRRFQWADWPFFRVSTSGGAARVFRG
jgi:hypothetical protein